MAVRGGAGSTFTAGGAEQEEEQLEQQARPGAAERARQHDG